MSSSFAATFSLDPSKFPYTKQCIATKRNARVSLQNQLFFDLVLAEVARIPESSRLYPPRNTTDLRNLHEAIEGCAVDLLKKQCCIYYILRDWDTHTEYAEEQLIPQTYCALMDSYWYLDNQKNKEALNSLLTPGLTPNFATKIMSTFERAGDHSMLVTYVQTMQNPLDTEEKTRAYLKALMRVDVSRALFFTRTTTVAPRQSLFNEVVDHAKTTKEGVDTLARFPFDVSEGQWAFENLSRTPGPGMEALIVRLTMMGDTSAVIKLREKHGGGKPDLNNALKESLHSAEAKLLQRS
ncbi:Putative uncharacterized protein [Taphrina deformans PYCC 5710]|uniref:ELYS-like domain-containing protein n=1 Tax=Taphrina deformans (strain PYCC 5710 / ATCC 11124 / CBS 356.35 / IMI 108563 / JCM 9778 / NBRC 8474) TaxID=1097556 RepID=R4X9I2_TAPDE|nr:Putative uncharacterized protein [Taphrina deformans PYCC 5710]|eukprot:CCG80884.1 Putative uncharacterized protein [Taphrina deformans PYCC 5710]